ncbi:MAG: 5-formyltetrahydrofolate cyclo-ligase [Bacteroidota bacterium]|nr:5-formyltetrahydrofolate cyclo-ligase [Bacteroidota bacterium]
MEEKKILRKQIRDKKKLYSLEEKKEFSKPIFERIERLEIFQKAKTLLCYWSMEDEVFTQDFVNKWYKSKTLLLPCVEGNDLVLRQYLGKESMKAGEQFGILEPTGKEYTDFENIDIMIIPGVAFDSNKNRMGRGRGFYDRLLNTLSAKKIGICFDFQIVESVPTESFDIKMDVVISSSFIFQ